MTRRVFTIVTLVVAVLIAAPVEAQEGDEPSEGGYVLEGDLVPEEAVPGPGPDPAGAIPILSVAPESGSLCYDIRWDQIDPLTGFIIRLGYPEESASIEVDFALTPPDELDASSSAEGFVAGCVESEPELLEFIANEPDFSHITVYSADYPQGAAGGFLRLISGPGFEPEEHDEEPIDAVTTVLVAPLTPEHVLPEAPDIDGSGNAVLEVTPLFDTVCWDITWDLDETVTEIHLHPGGIEEIDPEEFRLDFIKEARTFGGEVESDLTTGCISVTHVVDFFGLVEEPEGHYIDLHTDQQPDGALRGQLIQEDEFVTAIDEGHEHEEEEAGRGLVDYVPHLLALVGLMGATIFAIYTFRKSRDLYDSPSRGAAAAAAVSYALLLASAVIMLLDSVLAPESGLCGDSDRFAALGLVLAGAGLVVAGGAIALAGSHPPLRRVAIAVALGAAAAMVAWVIWAPAGGCTTHGDVEPDEHAPTITETSGPLDCAERVSMHGDPVQEFEGFATHEEAVAASAASELGTAKHYQDDEWIIEMDGRIVAMVTVGDWQEGRYVVFDTEICSDVEHLLGF